MNMTKNKEEISFTEGSIFRSLIRFALPVLGALILQAAYGAVDVLVVGRYGDASSISAVGTGSVLVQFVTFVINNLAMGLTVTIGRHTGAKQKRAAGNAVGTAVIMFIAVGIVLSVLLVAFAGQIARLMQVPEESFDKTVLYMRICCSGTLVIIAYNVISAILRGFGDAKRPFLFVGIACVVNIAGDLILTGALGMDVAGVAIATVFAQLVSVVISLIVLCRQKLPMIFSLKQCRFHPKELRLILGVGIPMAIQDSMVQLSFIVINSICNNMGLIQSAGYGVAVKLVTFLMLVPSAVMQTVSAYIAQNVGAGNYGRARKGLHTAIFSASSVGIVIFCIGFFGGGLLSSFFTDDADVIIQSADYLRGYSMECFLSCILFSFCGFFNGNGKSIPVMVQGITSALFLRIPIALFMSHLPNTSLTLVGLATPITTVYGLIFFGICFIWFNAHIKKTTEPTAFID